MKHNLRLSILLLLLAITFAPVQGQTLPRGIADPSGITLVIQGTGGTNGSAVAWNPVQRKYYAVIAGNASYPLETFDFDGKPLGSIEAGVDVRGLWWNTGNNTLECNEYGSGEEGSSTVYTLWDVFDLEDGKPTGSTEIVFDEGTLVPSEQSIGTFDPVKKTVLYYSEGVIFSVSRVTGKAGKQIKLKDIPCALEDLNSNTLLYTGIKGYEYGLLNFTDGHVLLFSAKGKFVSKVSLPATATVNYAFWASYANGQLWLYNADTRTWTGYKLFR